MESNQPSEVQASQSSRDTIEQQKNIAKLDNLMNNKDRTDVQYFNVYFAGPSGLGKTITCKRLVKLIINIKSLPDELKQQCSTFLAECKQVLAIVDESKGIITFEVAEGLEDETRLIYKYLLGQGAGRTKRKALSQQQPSTLRNPVESSIKKPAQSVPIQPEPDSVGDKPNPAIDPQALLVPTPTSSKGSEEDENVIEIVTVDVDKVIEGLRAIVGSGKYAEVLMGKILLNLVDIGGQPGFTEMIPFLTKGIGIFLAFFPLDKNLDDPYEVSYERDGAKITPYKSTYSIREMLSQLLSSVAHNIPRDVTIDSKFSGRLGKLSKIKPVATLIGTFKDRLEIQVKTELLLEKLSKIHTEDLTKVVKHILERESDYTATEESSSQLGDTEAPEEIQSKVNQLLSSKEFSNDFEERFKEKLEEKRREIRSISSKFEDLLLHPEGEEFFAVDNLKGTPEDLESLRKHICDVFATKLEGAKLPVLPSQLLLGVVLRKEYNIVSMDDCIKIGKALNMDKEDVQFAVWYLSGFIGSLIHRPDIKDEEDWFKKNLICSPQVVFDSISTLIVEPLLDLHCHGHKSTFSVSERKNWRQKGQFSLDTIQQCQQSNSEMVKAGKLIPVDKLVLLLEHSHLLAPIKTSEKEKIMYFMPAILECATPKELWKPPPTDIDTPSPIKITFKHGYLPIGLFSAIISKLASKGSEHCLGTTWKLVDSHVKRNLVSFYVDESAEHFVTLIAHINSIEIRLLRKDREYTLYELCSYVLSTVLLVIKEINSLAHPIIALNCPCEQHKSSSDKLCLLTPGIKPAFKCSFNVNVSPKPEQECWFTKEANLSGDSLKAFPYGEVNSSLSFKWLKYGSTLGEDNELVIHKMNPSYFKGFFTCEVLKNKQKHFNVYHRFKRPDGSSTTSSETTFLDEVREATKSICANWYSLAIELDINYATRKDIETSHRFAEVCWRVMLKHWVECSSPAPTWSTLVTALQSRAIDQCGIARSLAGKTVQKSFGLLSKPVTLERFNKLDVDKHLKIIREAIWDTRCRWCDLGLMLGVCFNTLNVIDSDYRTVEHCFTAMLEYWMRGEGMSSHDSSQQQNATLSVLIEALSGQVINRCDVAAKITKLLVCG